jgi:F-type H+-transporting ATPase subunit b
MHIDWATLALQTVNALILIWLLARFLFRPVADIIAARQKEAQALLADAEASRQAAQIEEKAAHDERAQLVAARSQALQAVDADAAARKEALLAAARADVVKLHADAEAEIDRLRVTHARAEEDDAVRLAVEIAARLVDRMPSEARVEGFIAGAAQALAGLPPDARAEFGASGAPLALAVPRALNAGEQHACEAAFSAALGRPVALKVSIDPTLIAGIQITSAHAVVRNHLRHDLDAIRATLLEHDDERR